SSASAKIVSLQLRRKFDDQVFDPFRFVPMTNQKRIWRADDDQIMHAEQRDRCSIFLEYDVVAGIDRRDCAVRGVSALILLKIISHSMPGSNVVPIKAGLHHENAVGILHDGVIERDARQFAEALTQGGLKISRRAQL